MGHVSETDQSRKYMRQWRNRGGSEDFNFAGVDAQGVWAAICSASRAGGCLRIGTTRDGGSLAIGVYHGDSYWVDYLKPSDDVDAYFLRLATEFDGVGKPVTTKVKSPKKD